METLDRPVGELLRTWRRQRRVSQLDLALDAEVSTRHISFLETGRALPSRDMLLRLAEHLDIPLRERNSLLIAAGYAPVFPRTSLEDPTMTIMREAIELVLTGHEPYPAIAIDRYWNLITANRGAGLILRDVEPTLLEPPVNVLRISLHPDGLASRIINLNQWRAHVFMRLRRYIEMSADPELVALCEELQGFSESRDLAANQNSLSEERRVEELVIPLRLQTSFGQLSFFSTTTVFGTANEVTLSELAIESFFPADRVTAETLRQALDNTSFRSG
jgi:transcriptional regulator with XRE-family HTH domain